MKLLFVVPCLAALFLGALAAANQEVDSAKHWTTSWTTAPQSWPVIIPEWVHPPPAAANPPSPAESPVRPIPEAINNQTIRMIARSAIGGTAVRVQLTNASGNPAVVVGSLHIAQHGKGSSILKDSDRPLTVGGRPSFEIPSGAVVVSDPIEMKVAPLTEFAVSIYIPGTVPANTVHALGLHTSYVATGDVTADDSFPAAGTNSTYFWLTGIEVLASHSATIVALGDSITDGFMTTPDRWNTWPDQLTEQLLKRQSPIHWAVVNVGISGNRLRRDGAGLSALARIERDVLDRPGVKWVVLFEGINDINIGAIPGAPNVERTDAESLIWAYKAIIATAHSHGIRVLGATLMPCEGIPIYSAASESMRQTINDWIRHGAAFDTVADLDSATRDPAHPTRLRPDFDSGDHIHPNDAGTLAIARAININRFMAGN